MPTTPTYKLPYPSLSSPNNPPYDFQQLAEKIEDLILSRQARRKSENVKIRNTEWFRSDLQVSVSTDGHRVYLDGAVLLNKTKDYGWIENVLEPLPQWARPSNKVAFATMLATSPAILEINADGSTRVFAYIQAKLGNRLAFGASWPLAA